MQNHYRVPPAADVARAPRVERLSMTDEQCRLRGENWAEIRSELKLVNSQIEKCEAELKDPATSPSRRKTIRYQCLRLKAKKSGLDRALAAANRDTGEGKTLHAAEAPSWTERHL